MVHGSLTYFQMIQVHFTRMIGLGRFASSPPALSLNSLMHAQSHGPTDPAVITSGDLSTTPN
jgi:hypothetical protein